jgi:hypothetical protein
MSALALGVDDFKVFHGLLRADACCRGPPHWVEKYRNYKGNFLPDGTGKSMKLKSADQLSQQYVLGTSPRRIRFWFLAGWCFLLAGSVLICRLWSSSPGDALTRNTIRLALVWYGLGVSLMLCRASPLLARSAWTLAWLSYVIHVGMAFHYQHAWSHRNAVEHVRQASGVGEGLYASYLFTLLWTVDVLWWQLVPASRARRSVWIDAFLHGFMLFMIFNATIVFESGFIRWAGVALFEILGRLVLTRHSKSIPRYARSGSVFATTEKKSWGGPNS